MKKNVPKKVVNGKSRKESWDVGQNVVTRRLRESWPFRHIEKKGDLFRLIFG
jgi:hypothetical protein